MFLKKSHTAWQRGDTIVEVMIVLAVLGFALGIAYATANRSLLNVRQAHENSEVATLLQSQIEGIRTLSSISSPAPAAQNIYISTPYCISYAGGTYSVVATTSPSCQNVYQRYQLTVYYCGRPGFSGYGVPPCNPAITDDTFIATAVWDDAAGDGQDHMSMSYRAHQQ